MTPTPPTPTPPSPPSRWRAPTWLQAVCIVGLLGSAIFVALDGRYLWASLLTLAGVAFGLSFLLRRMVGDEYDRT